MTWLCESISEGPKRDGNQGAIPKICQATWKQMFHAAKVLTESEWGWGDGNENTNTFSFLQSLFFFPLKQKPDLLFGSRSRKGQRKSQCISISCSLSSPMSVELNLGWPSNVPKEVCLAEWGKKLVLEDSLLQLSAHKLSIPSDPCQYYNGKNKIKKLPFSSERQEFYVQQALDSASLANIQAGYRNSSATWQIKAALWLKQWVV